VYILDDYLEKMLKMQDELDSFILEKNNANPTLVDKCVALLVESIEFIEECGYKWWKKPKTNDSSLQSDTRSDDNIYKDKLKCRSVLQGSVSSQRIEACKSEIRDERLKEELIDILHFWLSICNSLNLNSEEIFKIYKKKWEINFERQNE